MLRHYGDAFFVIPSIAIKVRKDLLQISSSTIKYYIANYLFHPSQTFAIVAHSYFPDKQICNGYK